MKLRILFALGVTSAVMTACGGSSSDSADPARRSTASATSAAVDDTPVADTAYDGPTIPEGIYLKKLHRRQFRALGVDLRAPEVGDRFAPDGTTYVSWKFTDSAFAQFEGKTPETLAVGSSGSYRYDARGRLILTEACCGDTTVLWHGDGDTLTLKLAAPPQALKDPMGTLMVTGTYNRNG
jgi:hypothetical protein